MPFLNDLLSKIPRSPTVPTTKWSAGASNWKASPTTLVMVSTGNWLYGAGEAALVNANIGQTPGTVLAQGISAHAGVSLGWSTFYISVAVMLLWIPLRRAPGLGTLINIILVSISIDVMLNFFPHPKTLLWQVMQVLLGILIIGIASALYITSNLGAGPRDGLMTGLHFTFGWPIARVRLAIEGVLLISGWALGGQVGLGTVLVTVLVGETIAICFGIANRVAGVTQV